MATMIRKQIYLEARQDALLKALARRLGVSEAELIRRSLDRTLGGAPAETHRTRPAAWQEALAFCLEWVESQAHQPTRPWTREQLYEERLKRYGSARTD